MMRITSLTMQNFRCFRDSTTLDLDADVVAIYGRNGSGKTTAFDAIEFAFLGEIGRFASETQPLASYVPNAFESGLPVVRVEYCENGGRNHIEASLEPDSSIKLGPNWSNHRDLLYQWLVQDGYEPARREVGPIRDLFRASVLLSQWSIRQYIGARPDERASVLAHIAGVSYLQRCLEKAQEVQKLAERRGVQNRGKSQGLAEERQHLTAELTSAEQRRKGLRERIGDKLVRQQDLALAVDAAQLTIPATFWETQNPEEIAVAVNALCRESLDDLDKTDRALIDLRTATRGYRTRVEEKHQLSKKQESLQTSAALLERRRHDLSGAILSTQAKIRAAGTALEDSTERLLSLDEIAQLLAQLPSQREQVRSSRKREHDLQNAIQNARARFESLYARESEVEANRVGLVHLRERTNIALERLRQLRQSLPAYRSDVQSLRGCDLRKAQVEQELKGFQERQVTLQLTHDGLTNKLAAGAQRHKELSSGQQRKNGLIAALREYATGNQCPMCGATHQTPEALASAIEKQLQTAPAEIRSLAKQIESDRAEKERVESEIGVASESIGRCEKQGEAVAAERARLETRIAAQDGLANQAGTKMEAESIGSALSALEARVRENVAKLEAAEAQVRQLIQERSQVELTVNQYEASLAQERQKIVTSQGVITRLSERAADLGLNDAINWSSEELTGRRAEVEKEQGRVRGQKSNDEDALRKFTGELNSVRDSRERVEADLNECTRSLVRVTEAVNRADRLCQQVGVTTDNPEEAVELLSNNVVDRRRKIEGASTIADGYRWSSALSSLSNQEQLLRKRQEEVLADDAALEEERRNLGKAGETARIWSDRLREEVTRIVERRIRTHQPEILRLFRAMVPCPYLFEEIEMRRSNRGVHLGLRYRDQVRAPAEPKFFLSEAQANVLALAVFLSFAGSQQWSRLETIFLDDPVQHLDDLDAVAFLDNLRAVALERRKQVIVSTCDQNLYLLMIRKFRVIGKEGINFRGISLLENGGNAPEVVYDVGGPSLRAAVA